MDVNGVKWTDREVAAPVAGEVVEFGLLPEHGGLFSVKGELFLAGSLNTIYGFAHSMGALFYLLDRMVGESPWEHEEYRHGMLVVETLSEQQTLVLREQVLTVLEHHDVYVQVVETERREYYSGIGTLSKAEISRFVDFLERSGGLVYVQRMDDPERWRA